MTGEIEKRKKGQYRIRLFLGRDPETGKRLRPSKTINGTRKEAEQALREWISQYESGRLPTVTSKLTLNTYLAEWFEIAKKPDVGERTLSDYKADMERYVAPTLGRMFLAKITVVDVQGLYTEMLSKGLSVATIRRVHSTLNQAFKQAVRWRKISYSPTADVQVPRSKNRKKVIKAMDGHQVDALLKAAIETPHRCLFEVAVASGMRPGEYLGLGWPAVDWKLGGVRVERAVVRPKGAKPFLGPPKTPESRRTIPLPPSVMESLRDHRRAQNEWRLFCGPKWNSEHDLVFPDQYGGFLDYANIARRTFNALLKRAGLPKEFNLYSLRHTMATLLLMAGENPKIVQERLGHATIAQTMDTYSHVIPTMQKGASDKLEGILFGPR